MNEVNMLITQRCDTDVWFANNKSFVFGSELWKGYNLF